MCYWYHYYYGGCQHQETVVHTFCDKATDITPDSPSEKEERGDADATEPSGQDGGKSSGDNTEPRQEGSESDDAASPSSTAQHPPSSSKKSTTQHRTAPSSFSFSSTSSHQSFTPIPEETAEDIASLEEQKNISPRRHSEPATADMAGLAPFGKSTFRKLMDGGNSPQLATPVTTTKNHNDREEMKPELNQQGGSLRIRQPGIRDQSDESYILPDSNEILQHISGSCRGDFSSARIGTDPRRESSYGSDVHGYGMHDSQSHHQDSFDTIESDLDVLKTEITALRAVASEGSRMDVTQDTEQFPNLPNPVRSSKIPVPEEPAYESHAAKLKLRFEAQEREKQARLAREKWERENKSPERPPGIEHFPNLGSSSSTASSQKTVRSSNGGQGTRKLSYASAASSGTKAAFDKLASGTRSNNGSDVVSVGSRTSRGSISSFNSPQQTFVSPSVVPSQVASDAGDNSVIISPQAASAGTSSTQAAKATPWATVAGKQSSPRFAQPTKATARRADETLRKDSATTLSKVSPEGSPNKSVRTAVQRQNKRPSIPGAWTNSPETSPTKQSFAPTSPSRSQAPELSKLASSPKASPEQPLRKKTSSYMSPTKATTRRNIETLGQENVKQASPRLSKAPAKIDTNISPVKAVMSPMENTPPLSAPLSGSTVVSASSGFEEHNITERVMQHLMTGKPPGMRDTSATSPEFVHRRELSSATTSVFESPVESSSQLGRRNTVGSPVSQMVVDRAQEAGLPQVANTTIVKRRGSHGHLLNPIIKRLDKSGLLRSPPSVAEEPESSEEFSPLAVPPTAAQSNNMMPPPGLSGPNISRPSHLPPHIMRDISFQAALQNLPGNAGPRAQGQGSRTGSLRATAEEFKPTWKPQTVQQEAGLHGWQGDLDWRSPEEWNTLTRGVQDTIRTLRQFNKAEGSKSPRRRRQHDTYPLAYSPSKNSQTFGQGAASWDPSSAQVVPDVTFTPAAPAPAPAPTTARDQNIVPEPERDQPYFTTKEAPQPYAVETGAVLNPELDPITNILHWIKESPDGRREAVSFGRAPAPDNFSPGTVTISPSSNDSSPPKPFTPSPNNSRRWRISSLMSDKYGWKGGDGLEISFRGSGPSAERDPNPPSDVNFGYHNSGSGSGSASHGAGSGNGARFVGGHDDGPGSPPLAPRSREQWAKLAGLSKVPCNELLVSGYEMYPRPPLWMGQDMGPYGFCDPCYPGH